MKKILALVLSVIMIAVAAIGGTLAYLTDTASATNVFTVGNIDIELDETAQVLDVNGVVQAGKVVEVKNEDGLTTGHKFSQIMPTNKIVKTAVITNKSDTTDAYVRVAVVVNNLNKILSVFENGTVNLDDVITGTGWHLQPGGQIWAVDSYTPNEAVAPKVDFVNSYMNSTDAYKTVYNMLNNDEIVCVYYAKLDKKSELTLDLSMSVPNVFDAKQLAMFDELKIEIYADAIQAEGFNIDADGNAIDVNTDAGKLETAQNAFAALEAAHVLREWRFYLPTPDVRVLTVPEIDDTFDSFVPYLVTGYQPADGMSEYIPFALEFSANDELEKAIDEGFSNWNADFVISFNKDLENGGQLGNFIDKSKLIGPYSGIDLEDINDKIILAGHYDGFAAPLGFEGKIVANKEYEVMPIVGMLFGQNWDNISYGEVIDIVKYFKCGVAYTPFMNTSGLVITLDLRVYETEQNPITGEYEETGKEFVVYRYVCNVDDHINSNTTNP